MSTASRFPPMLTAAQMIMHNTGPSPPHALCSQLSYTAQTYLHRTSLPHTTQSLGIASILLRHGLVSNLTLGSTEGPLPAAFDSLPQKDRRIWIYHKFRNGLPVLRQMRLISKPSVRRIIDRQELGRLLMGKRAKSVPGVGMGEILVIRTRNKGKDVYMDGWEAWRAGLGGEVLCRVS
ncbi:ribosomal protein S8 [Naematelia encephala]|uniref:Ribosomal protein S8 n=1 Tax=Naematelia encephala TaxID=71784 RepID=A0A1Y2AYY5_9TREE|nr:ribosomal protein S8 [Naematelia encephala]